MLSKFMVFMSRDPQPAGFIFCGVCGLFLILVTLFPSITFYTSTDFYTSTERTIFLVGGICGLIITATWIRNRK